MKLFSRFFANTAIQIRGAKPKLIKGKLKPKTMREISILCSDLSIQHAEVWIDAVGKVTFSKEINERLHQRFRNVLSQ
jgi:hypothetical protein